MNLTTVLILQVVKGLIRYVVGNDTIERYLRIYINEQ
jgi:hypothetical protein